MFYVHTPKPLNSMSVLVQCCNTVCICQYRTSSQRLRTCGRTTRTRCASRPRSRRSMRTSSRTKPFPALSKPVGEVKYTIVNSYIIHTYNIPTSLLKRYIKEKYPQNHIFFFALYGSLVTKIRYLFC